MPHYSALSGSSLLSALNGSKLTESYPAFSKHTKWLLTAAVAVVPLKTMEK